MTAPTKREMGYQRHRRFADHIQDRCQRPGTRAALRSGLRRAPEQAIRMHAVVANWVTETADPAEERAYYTVAALIAGQSRGGRDADAQQRDEALRPDQSETAPPPDPPAADATAPHRGRSLGRCLADLEIKTRASRSGPPPSSDATASLTPLEQRLHALSRQSLDGLHRHLPAVVLRLRGAQVPVDWAQLLTDLARWPRERDHITKRWLQDFYRYRVPASTAPNDKPSAEGAPQ